ncbi:MAG: type II toxin-antitoxin system VapC family toxin [Sciscionella sp.]
MNVDIIVDNSALIEVVTGAQPHPALLRQLMLARAAAPELLDAEALSVIRRMARSRVLSTDRAKTALLQIQQAPLLRLPHRPLLERAWELRHSISAYDALYVALAEQLDVPLVTCDAKLASSNGHHAEIELYPIS